MVRWNRDNCIFVSRDHDIMFCMALDGDQEYNGTPLQLPAFTVTNTGNEIITQELPSEHEEEFKKECEKYGVTDYKLLRAYMLYYSPKAVWEKDDLWLETLPFVGMDVRTTEYIRDHLLDFSEDDIICESKVKLKSGEYKIFRVKDINSYWLSWLEERQDYTECAEVYREMFKYMERFKNLPLCFRFVTTGNVAHAYSMHRWYTDAIKI